VCTTACDQGTQHDQARGTGGFVRVVQQNVSTSKPLPANGRIELAFDRYLLPNIVTRQSFVLFDLQMRAQTPNVAYDPVTRIVTITPTGPLQIDQTYELTIDRSNPKAPLSIDGAPIDPASATIAFPVVPSGAALEPAPPTVDFCKDILPIFQNKCSSSSFCHSAPAPPNTRASGAAAGLRLDSLEGIAATAVGRVAQGSNTGPRASPRPPGSLFGINMPIIDPGTGAPASGDPANSWLMYKLLLAVPSQSSMTMAMSCDGGATVATTPTDVSTAHLVPPGFTDAAQDPARAVLSDYVLGREMPFPPAPVAPDQNTQTLTVDELERVSRWIGQPQTVGSGLLPATCNCQ
jgi:hypothetical protein